MGKFIKLYNLLMENKLNWIKDRHTYKTETNNYKIRLAPKFLLRKIIGYNVLIFQNNELIETIDNNFKNVREAKKAVEEYINNG